VRALWHRLRNAPRGPLIVAGLLSAPLFFASLMASSLALERPTVVHEWINTSYWRKHGHPGRHFRQWVFADPSTANELKIWLAACIPVLILVAIGACAMLVRRYGSYISAGAGIVIAWGVQHRVDTWVAHHTLRFPYGEDLIPKTSTGDIIAQGEWEHNAKVTALSLIHWTWGIALIAIAIMLFNEIRRRRRAGRPEPPLPAPIVVPGDTGISPEV
jgi:hypothetical protein